MNCIKIRKRSLLYYYFCFFDAPEHLAEGSFERYEAKVEVLQEIQSPDYPFVAIFCRVRKRLKDLERFVDAMDDLKERIACIHPDFEQFCNDLADFAGQMRAGGNLNG